MKSFQVGCLDPCCVKREKTQVGVAIVLCELQWCDIALSEEGGWSSSSAGEFLVQYEKSFREGMS